VAKVTERLAVNKQRSQRFHMERLNLKKLNEVEGEEQDISGKMKLMSLQQTVRARTSVTCIEE
jgi:hypothetical protein